MSGSRLCSVSSQIGTSRTGFFRGLANVGFSSNSSSVYDRNSGWLEVAPVVKSPTSVKEKFKFIFPRYYQESYSIGSSLINDFVLPAENAEDVPDVVFLTDGGKVWLKSMSKKGEVKIDDVPLEPNASLSIDMSKISSVIANLKFGPYNFVLCSASVSNIAFQLASISRCIFCNNRFVNPRPLPCGHIACQTCLTEQTNRALDAADRAMQLQLLSHNSVPLTIEFAKVKCIKCWQSTPIDEIAEGSTSKIFSVISDAVQWLVNARYLCASCGNVRCVAGPWDYWKCNTCRGRVCPLCALEQHCDHELRLMYEIVVEFWMKWDKLAAKGKCDYRKTKADQTNFVQKLQMAKETLSACQNEIYKAESDVSSILKSARDTFAKLKSLKQCSCGEDVESERINTLNCFREAVTLISRDLTPALKKFKQKISCFQRIETKFLPIFDGVYPEI